MPQKRTLPEAHNPLLEDDHTPPLEILIERRRLGQTDLHVKPGQVGLNNATKAENLGIFDYAHLRVPLPPNLKGSEIFRVSKNTPQPESYFLMRRSSDGYISATGMFKAAFPWASTEEEQSERKHHKTLPTAGHEEVAGNVWISPEHALELASEYLMRPWVIALLDPSPIELGTKDKSSHVNISTPPAFKLSEKDKVFPAPNLPASSLRKRELRSASPTKSNSPRKIATPRKRRTKASKAADDESARGQLENGTTGSASVEPTPSVASEQQADDVVRVEVDEIVEKENDVETTHTTVQISMPAGHKDLTLPDSAEGVLETSHEIITEARKLEKSKSSKRKAEEIDGAEEEASSSSSLTAQPPKKQKVLEDQLKTERVKARALIGITTAVAIGTMVTYLF